MNKKMVGSKMGTLEVLLVMAKLVAFAYLIGLCGGYENGTITGSQLAVRGAATVIFIIFG